MAVPLPSHRLLPVIAPLLETVMLAELGGPEAVRRDVLAQTTATMAGKLRQMPRFMGLGIAALTLAFDADGVRFGGGRFRDNPAEARLAQARAWRDSALPFLPDFMDFYGKMGVFVYWSHHEGE